LDTDRQTDRQTQTLLRHIIKSVTLKMLNTPEPNLHTYVLTYTHWIIYTQM